MTPPPIQRAEEAIRPLTREDWDKPGEAPVFEKLRKINQVFPELLAYAKSLEWQKQKLEEKADGFEKRIDGMNVEFAGLEAKVNEFETVRKLDDAEVTLFERCRALEAKVKELEKGWRCFQCGKLFLDEKEAADHFGTELNPRHSACKEVYLAMCDELEKAGIKSGFHNAASIVKLANQRDALQKRIDGGVKAEILATPTKNVLNEGMSLDIQGWTTDFRLQEMRKVLILPVEENIKAIALNPEATITIKVLPAEETV